jgi:thiamine-phosphate diphosphorylase/hydroxyethylthiazole kinase
MSVSAARKILGPSKIIGCTVSNVQEARAAVDQGADYLGIGTLYATNTKKNTKEIIGINGVRKILHFLGSQEDHAAKDVKTVCIGGVNASNIQLIKHQLYAPGFRYEIPRKSIDGVAVVSAIVADLDPRSAAWKLNELWNSKPPFGLLTPPGSLNTGTTLTKHIVTQVHEKKPLSHNMTNLVVQNLAASVALAIGASPIMSNNGLEAHDLAKMKGGLVINMGTATPEALNNHRLAIKAYNAARCPVVLDPVGAGATAARKDALRYLMASGYFDVIKGNEHEIQAVARASGFILNDAPQQRGVDSGDSLSLQQKAYYVSRIAARERNIVLMTGKVDVISDGVLTYSISNGHEYLGLMTGSGCALGTTISAYLAANPEDKLRATIVAMLHYEIAAEHAAKRDDVKGPGTFVPAFIDELWKRRMEVVRGDVPGWIQQSKMERIEDIPDLGLLKE